MLLFGLADPSDITPLVGRLAPAGPILLFEMVLLLFAPPVEVLIRMLPPAVVVLDVDEPSTVQLVMVLFCAPLMRRIVLVPAVAEAVVCGMRCSATAARPSNAAGCQDRFGVSWQIVPTALPKYLGGPNAAGARRAMQAMLKMVKLDIEGLRRAYRGQVHVR